VRVEDPGRRRVLSGAERALALRFDAWPFRRVVALRPRAGGGRRVLSVPLEVPPDAVLATAFGTHPSAWTALVPSAVRFEIDAVVDDERVRLAERTLDPRQRPADRGWFEVELPLGAWAGRRIELELATRCDHPGGERLALGGFALPRLVPGGSPR
jgi:hypothetical protein